MALLHEALEEKKFDVRHLEKNVNRNLIPAEDVQKQTKQLPDDAANAEWTAIDSLSAESAKSS